MRKLLSLSNLTLIVALSLSTVAAYYSIIGLTAIFAGAVIPVIVMGSMLEIGKITTTVWLRKYWDIASITLKLYLVPAVVLLALLTSMGIFGFLSKAHIEAGVTSGDSQAKLALIDEKIKTERDNVDLARKALQQMDAQVDARLSRGDSETGAERSVQIRRQQQGERAKLQKDIGDAQAKIAKLNEERAPIAAENRKIEAEVGPIKYVAALIYGDNPDTNLLERAVRWVIILLVAVFDPLAIALVLAANASREWEKKVAEERAAMGIVPPKEEDVRPFTEEEIKALDDTPVEEFKSEDEVEKFVEQAATETFSEIEKDESKIDFSKLAYLNKPWVDHVPGEERVKPLVYKPEEEKVEEPKPEVVEEPLEEKVEEPVAEWPTEWTEPEVAEEPVQQVEAVVEPIVEKPVVEELIEESNEEVPTEKPLTAGADIKISAEPTYREVEGGYVIYEGKMISKDALKEIRPELFRLTADSASPISTKFGIQFPRIANKGDMFVRVDTLPNRVYKFDGRRWFEINKDTVDTYLDEEYIKFLIDKIDNGEYDIEVLSEKEKDQIESYLNSKSK